MHLHILIIFINLTQENIINVHYNFHFTGILYIHWIQYDVCIIWNIKSVFLTLHLCETKINSWGIQSSKLSNLRKTNYVYTVVREQKVSKHGGNRLYKG